MTKTKKPSRASSVVAKSARVYGGVDASLGKSMDSVRVFNRAMICDHLPESDRQEYAAAYEAGYEAVCKSMRARNQ